MGLSILLLVLLGIDWASGYAIAGFVMQHGVSPYGYAFWQTTGPFLCLLIIELFRKDISITPRGLVYAFGCGIFGITIPNLLIYLAVVYVNSGILTVLANTSALFLYPLALLFKEESFKLKRFLMLLIGVVGMIILSSPGVKGVNIKLENMWLYLALLIPFCYAFSVVFMSRFRPKKDAGSLNYSLWMLLIASICIFPLTMFKHGFYYFHLYDFNTWLIILEIILSSLGYVLLFIIVKKVGAVYYTLVNAIAALMGILYSRFLFGHHFSGYVYIASGLIIVSIVGLTYTQKYYQEQRKRI